MITSRPESRVIIKHVYTQFRMRREVNTLGYVGQLNWKTERVRDYCIVLCIFYSNMLLISRHTIMSEKRVFRYVSHRFCVTICIECNEFQWWAHWCSQALEHQFAQLNMHIIFYIFITIYKLCALVRMCFFLCMCRFPSRLYTCILNTTTVFR